MNKNRPRRVTYVQKDGDVGMQLAMRMTAAGPPDYNWQSLPGLYVWDWSAHENVQLCAEDEGQKWAYGWRTNAAKALRATVAL